MSVSRNATYTAIGTALPSLLTLFTVPIYLSLVGIERFGVLTLCWVILGYSGLLDLGVGPAVSQRIAALRDSDDVHAAPIFWTALWLSLGMGLIGAAVAYFVASVYFGRVVNVDAELRSEVLQAIPLIVSLVPLQMVGSVLGGALQGRERFLTLNVLGAGGNVLMAALPLLLAWLWEPHLTALILGTWIARFIPFPFLYYHCKRTVPLAAPAGPSGGVVKDLFAFGGWVSLTAITINILNTVDRLAIGSMIGAAAVAAFTVPHSLVSRIILIPHSLGSVLFPRLAYVDEHERARLVTTSMKAVVVIITPMLITLVAITEPFFTLWVGPELTAISTPLAYVLAVGFWIYCLGHPLFSMLQAIGRPRTVAKLYVAELIPFSAVLMTSLWLFGLPGAAISITIRFTVETLVLLRMASVRLSTLGFLILPAALILASVAAAAELAAPIRYAVLPALLAASLVWSAMNAPEVLQPHLRKLAAILPLPRRWGGQAR